MKKRLFTCILFLVVFGLKSQIDPTLATQLQNTLNSKITAGNNGVSAFLIMPNGDTWSGTAGLNHQSLPITDSTLFHGASTTKFNVAVLMLLLAEDGLVSLDDSWHKYVTLNVNFDTLITIRQLLNHTSGIKDYLEVPGSGTLVTSNFNYSFTPQYILENKVSGVPDFPAGANFNYSTSNYVLAAMVAEAVTGNPIQTELRNRIWNPLRMKHTYFGACETYTEQTAGVWWNFESGLNNYSSQPTTSMHSYGFGGANIVTCPKDLAKLLHALMNNQVVNNQSLTQMQTFVPASYSSWTKGYGLGLHHSAQAGDTVLGHDGYYTNLTDMFYSKKYGFTLVTMTNTQTSWFGIFNPMYTQIKNHVTVGIPAYETRVELNIYPNPTAGELFVRCSEVITELNVKNTLGQICYQTKLLDKSGSFKLEKPGIYFLSLKTKEGTVSRKIVVNN